MASDKVTYLQENNFQTNSLYDGTCRRLTHEKKEMDEKHGELLQKQHGAPSKWIDRNAELREHIDELNRE